MVKKMKETARSIEDLFPANDTDAAPAEVVQTEVEQTVEVAVELPDDPVEVAIEEPEVPVEVAVEIPDIPAENGAGTQASVRTDDEIMAVLSEILKSSPRSKPTLVSFKPEGAGTEGVRRYVFVEMPEAAVKQAWDYYRANSSERDHREHFLQMLFDITHSSVPRMYRTCGTLSLEE